MITIKNAVAELLRASSKTFPAVEKSIPAKIENQINETIVGTNITPAINSFIVLPLEILAMKIPVNGAQAIHQAQ